MQYTYANNANGSLQPPELRPGIDPYATHNGFVKEYANGHGGSRATGTIAVTLNASSAPGDIIDFTVDAAIGHPFTARYTVPDPKPAGADVQADVLKALQSNPLIYALGNWSATATEINFESLEPGQVVRISAQTDPAKITATISMTQGTPFGLAPMPGIAMVTDSSIDYATIPDSHIGDRHKIAFPPSQDLNDPSATQTWAGINYESPDTEFAAEHNGYPMFASQGMKGVYQPQLRVKEEKYSAIYLETPFSGGAFPQLNYRYQADGDKDVLGAFSFETGTGLAPVPVAYTIDKVTNNGAVASVDFARH